VANLRKYAGDEIFTLSREVFHNMKKTPQPWLHKIKDKQNKHYIMVTSGERGYFPKVKFIMLGCDVLSLKLWWLWRENRPRCSESSLGCHSGRNGALTWLQTAQLLGSCRTSSGD